MSRTDVMPSSAEELRYMRALAEKYPNTAFAASEIIRIEALLRLPKGTEHFMSDLHGENEAFIHILNSASGVIREKIDSLFAKTVSARERADLATLIYYPAQKLPELKAQAVDLHDFYSVMLYRLIMLCRLVSSKHTRSHVRKCLPSSCEHILDELLHAHFEDHNKELYYIWGHLIESVIALGVKHSGFLRFDVVGQGQHIETEGGLRHPQEVGFSCGSRQGRRLDTSAEYPAFCLISELYF